MTDTLHDTRNIRMWAWEKKFPGFTEEIVEIFGYVPSVKQVSKWKTGWMDSLNNDFCMGLSPGFAYNVKLKTHEEIKKITIDCGIHPYFWDIHLKTEFDEGRVKKVDGDFGAAYVTKTMISFFYEEHLIMFKLAWQA